MKVGKILSKVAMGLGEAGLAAYGIWMIGSLGDYVKGKVRAYKSKQYKKGYDECYNDMKSEIEELKRENDRLYKEALQRTEAAE